MIVDFGWFDVIDLSDIDACAGIRGNQAFTFIDGAAFSAEGQVRVTHSAGDTFVTLNTSGTGTAEMCIHLIGIVGVSFDL